MIVDSHNFIAQPEAVKLSAKGHTANILALQKFYHGCHSYSFQCCKDRQQWGYTCTDAQAAHQHNFILKHSLVHSLQAQ